jgi:hypothetical protein
LRSLDLVPYPHLYHVPFALCSLLFALSIMSSDNDNKPEPRAEPEPELEPEPEPEPEPELQWNPLGNNGSTNVRGVNGTHNGIPWGWGATEPYIAPNTVFKWED